MAIKNYTTKVDIYTSLGEIQSALAKGGADKVMVDYNNGTPVAVTFSIPTPRGIRGFALPAPVEGTLTVFARHMLRDIWQTVNGVSIEPIDGRADHSALAYYLVHNVHGLTPGQCSWSTSRGNLAKPIYTEPEPVEDVEDIQVIPTANQTAFERLDDEDGRPVSTYIRCVLPCKPTIRGRQIILPRPPKRGGRKRRQE